MVVPDADTALVPARNQLPHNVGLVAEQIQNLAHVRPLHSNRPRELDPGGIEGDVDSSDDGEDLELEPVLVLADIDIIAASDLIHEQHLEDGDCSINL